MNAEIDARDALVIAASTFLTSKFADANAAGVTQGDLRIVVAKEPVYTLTELRGAIERVAVKGTTKEAEELVDMLAGCGEQRGDMMMEYTKQAISETSRELLKQLGVPVPCNCGRSSCVTEMGEGCGHTDTLEQLELDAAMESSNDDEPR